MKRTKSLTLIILVALLASLINTAQVQANPPAPDDGPQPVVQPTDGITSDRSDLGKEIDQPNSIDVQKMREQQALREQGLLGSQLNAVDLDRVLVILVEYGGTDTFTWTPGVSEWDPIGQADPAESTETGPGDCSAITGIPSTATDFTYGPLLHNKIPQPLSAADRSGDTIWTEDFSKNWFESFMFGNGVIFDYDRQDGSHVKEDFTGKSVKDYYLDMSGDQYEIYGDVIGWIEVNHSPWWYGADQCPGRRSDEDAANDGEIPGAGSPASLVKDALDKVNTILVSGDPNNLLPDDFAWANYDENGDGVIDRLWIVHAGYGEEDGTTLTNRTTYGESAIWSHSSSVSPAYEIGTSGIKAGAYIIMPENGGIGVFAHESGHNVGFDDLYSYGGGETSAGFWTLMADDWVGYPIGYQPPALDPWHLDNKGWLQPYTISDPSQVYTVTVGQASNFPGGEGVYRGVKIDLPDQAVSLPVAPIGSYNWWGGNIAQTASMLTLKAPVSVPAEGASLKFKTAYGIEKEWDFLWIQASTDGGQKWETLTNANTVCTHDAAWIGGLYGFPDDLCAKGYGGLTGYNASFPDYDEEVFALDAATYGGKDVLVRFFYMTDWGSQYEGPFIDDVKLTSGDTTLFTDGGEQGSANWTLTGTFVTTNGTIPTEHNYYLQWRNTGETGGYDAGLGDARFRYGPTNSGLLVWYNNNYYVDNEILGSTLLDSPSFGPKGRMLVVDANPEPYRDPNLRSMGYNNEAADLAHRSSMRDAPFSLNDSVDFNMKSVVTENLVTYTGRTAQGVFDDSLGYYPGLEYVSRGPAYDPIRMAWMTSQWDASAVVPSLKDYAVKAEGYSAGTTLLFECSPILAGTSAGKTSCYGFGTGMSSNGGTGNPGDVGGQYGWRVEILSQTAEKATLRIWNTNAAHTFVPDKTRVSQSGLVKYSYNLNSYPSEATNLFVCADLDTTKVEYVSSGANAVPLTVPCSAMSGMAVQGMSLAAAEVDPADVVAIGFSKLTKQGDSATFDFTVKALTAQGTLDQSLHVYEGAIYRPYEGMIHRLYEAVVTVVNVATYKWFMPVIGK